MIPPLVLAPQTVTWVKVEKPSFDLVGVLVSSIGATVLLAAVAVSVGILLGIARVRHARAQAARSASISLGLHH